ncbi:MAG: methionyl-tRNA formyltransferase [Solirubrobacteraceae bacterium]
MRTVYLGTSAFAATVLRALASSAHRPALVVSRPDAPYGRGRRLRPPPAATAARELGIDCYQPASVNDQQARARIRAAAPEALCVCAFGALIKEPLLSEHRILNVHPSLLPRWRGAAPIERAIMAGDERTGVSIMVVTAGLDSGPVCLQAAEPISAQDTYGSLAERLAALGASLLVQVLDGHGPCTEQDESLATYAAKLTGADRMLDPDRPVAELERVVRALTPHIGAHVALDDGTLLGVRRVRTVDGDPPDGPPNGVLSLAGPLPRLGCVDGSLELLEVQPPGRRAMAGEDYVRGLRN